MIYCDNETCKHAKRDHHGDLRCSSSPSLQSVADERLVCHEFELRAGPTEELHPGRNKTGLFPGQIGYRRE